MKRVSLFFYGLIMCYYEATAAECEEEAGGACYNVKYTYEKGTRDADCRVYIMEDNKKCEGVTEFIKEYKDTEEECFYGDCVVNEHSCAIRLVESNYTKQVCPKGLYCSIPYDKYNYKVGVYLAVCLPGRDVGEICYVAADDDIKPYCMLNPCKQGLTCNQEADETTYLEGRCEE